MATTTVRGKDLLLAVDGVAIGCANSVSFNSTVTMVDAACKESGDHYDGEPDTFTATLSASGFKKYDTPADDTKMRSDDLFTLHKNKTKIDWMFASPGAPMGKQGQAFITSYEDTGDQEGGATYSVELQVVGPYGPVANPVIVKPTGEAA